MEIKTYIDDLFRYLQTYEDRYAEFKVEAFIQTYNGIRTVFQTLREQRDQAVEVDYTFLDAIKLAPLTSSDLRQLTVQVLISFFESEADIDGRSNQAYTYCRGLRPVKQDVPYFEEHLLPTLFREGAFHNNFELHSFMLEEMSQFLNRFGRPLKSSITPEEFGSYSDGMKFLVLCRRRLQLGDGLLTDRASLEYDLQRLGTLSKLGQKHKLFEAYLTKWNYLQRVTFLSKIKAVLTELLGKAKGFFSSYRYTRLVFSQRRPAFFKYGLFIIFWIVLALLVPRWWQSYEDGKLKQMNERVENIRKHAGR